MRRLGALCRWMVTISSLTNVAIVFAKWPAQRLQPDEYGIVALIYNDEITVLGNRALFPICIAVPSETPAQPLLRYLLKAGFDVSRPSVCQPAMGPGGQHRAKDYPHGLRIFIDQLQHESQGLVRMRVATDDLTMRPGEHFATTLRRGTYHFKKERSGEWQIADYTKEYDFKDEKAHNDCDCAQTSPQPK